MWVGVYFANKLGYGVSLSLEKKRYTIQILENLPVFFVKSLTKNCIIQFNAI